MDNSRPSINNILIDFDTVIDIDIGIAKLFNDRYNNASYVNDKTIGLPTETYKTLFLNRINENPLVMLLQKEYWNSANSLRDQILDSPERYADVLKGSTSTGIFNMVLTMKQTVNSGCNPTILCKNEADSEFIQKTIPGIAVHIADDRYYNGLDVTPWDTIIVKNIYTPKAFKNLHGKNIYICKYRFNMDPSKPTSPIIGELLNYHLMANDVYMIDVYAETTLDTPAIENETKGNNENEQ